MKPSVRCPSAPSLTAIGSVDTSCLALLLNPVISSITAARAPRPEALERINASLPAAWNAISYFAVPRALAPSGSADWYFELSVESTRIHASRLAGRVGVGHRAVNCCSVQSVKFVQATSGKRLRRSSMLTW
jgi:hypothetical protein